MPFRSLRLPAQTLRNSQKIMLAGKRPEEDSDIKHMTVLIFSKCLDLRRNVYSRTVS